MQSLNARSGFPRILILDSLPPDAHEDVYFRVLSESLFEQGFESVVLSPRRGKERKGQQDNPSSTHPVAPSKGLGGAFLTVKRFQNLAARLRDQHFDLIHTRGLQALLMAALRLRRPPIPLIHSFTSRDSVFDFPWWTRRLIRGAFRLISQNRITCIVPSETAMMTIENQIKLKGINWKIIAPCIDLSSFSSCRCDRIRIRESLNLSVDSFVVGVVSVPSSDASSYSFIAQIMEVASKLVRIRFLLSAPHQRFLDFLSQEKLSRLRSMVTFLGEGQSETWQYAASEVILSVEGSTNFPSAAIKAMAAGVPTAAPDLGANREFLNVPFWVSGAYRPDSVVDAVRCIEEVHRNPEGYALYAREIKAYVIKKYHLPHVVDEYLNLYRGIHEAGKERPAGTR